MSDPACPIKPLPGLTCLAQPSLIGDLSNLVVPGGSDPVAGGGGKGNGNASNSGKRRAAPSVLNLSIRRRLSLRDVHRNGVRLKATVPSTTRRVRVRMYRLVTKHKNVKRVRVGEYVQTFKKIKKGGRISVTWKSKVTRKLKAGSYLIQVDAGPKKGTYFPGGAQVKVRIVSTHRR
jgi:3'-phosphoadenosine 5'-phosphosulfate sulfotransferase